MALPIQNSEFHYSGESVYIKPNYIITKHNWEGGSYRRSIKQKENAKNLRNNTRKGTLSPKAISNLRNSINWLLHSAKYKSVFVKKDNKHFYFKVNFITLTIPPQKDSLVSEKEFQKCLNTFLVYARKYFYLSNYVWKVEAHEDNRLHIHLTTDTFINHKRLRDSWNRILQSKGLLENHFSKFGHYSPNSTDVHAVHKVHNVAGYLCEYMVKKPNLPEGYTGRIWSCSYSLSPKNKCNLFIENDSSLQNLNCLYQKEIRSKPIESKPDSMGNKKKLATIYFVTEDNWKRNINGMIRDRYMGHIRMIRSGTRNAPKEYRQIDFISFKNVNEKYEPKEIINTFIPCATKRNTARNGLIQSALQF